MPRYLILAQSEATAHALNAWRELLGLSEDDDTMSCPRAIVHPTKAHSAEAGTTVYSSLVERIECLATNGATAFPLNDVVMMVDSIRPLHMSAVGDGTSWENLIALLILTFPEIKWVFAVIGNHDTVETSAVPGSFFPEADHNLMSLLSHPRRDPLFDPTGLREWVRSRTNIALNRLSEGKNEQTIEARYRLASRRFLAATIDEEVDYALMHGHAAYRYGFRVDVITTWALMKSRFNPNAEQKRGSHGYQLLLEDMRLVFPDKPAHIHLSRLANDRELNCHFLEDAKDSSHWRILITTGQEGSDGDLISENEGYLYNKRKGRGEIVFKPIGGIADLWKKAGLYDDLWEGNRLGNAHGFDWPPAEIRDELYDGHGAPGRLGLIATTLIRRASQLLKLADSPVDFIHCAVLATD